jgi:hypothetical protein
MEIKFSEKNRFFIKQAYGIDEIALDSIEGEINTKRGSSITARYPFLFYSILSVILFIVYPLWGIKRKIKVLKDENFILVSCPDPIFRTQNIGLIANDLKYCMIYLPNFHVIAAYKYDRFFKKQGIDAFFPIVKLRHVVKAYRTFRILRGQIERLTDNAQSSRMMSVLASYAIYNEITADCIKEVVDFKGKWLLEHQKFYFMAMVNNLHAKGFKSTMLQHGIFFEKRFDYIPLICDNVYCCSEREKRIYVENGTPEDRVYVFGAPLQTLQLTKKGKNTGGEHYDLLVLVTAIKDSNLKLTKDVLSYIQRNYKSVLIRMRPRSRKADEELLHDVLQGMVLSPVGTSIGDDIMNSKKVISFSVDANIEVAKYKKPFVYIWNGENSEIVKEIKCATRDNFKEEIDKLMSMDFYSTFSEDQYREILGETDIEILKKRFSSFVLDE